MRLCRDWGGTRNLASVLLDGCSLPITQNLMLALRGLRLRESQRVLWIDSICINQFDIDERNSQVRIMNLIYEKAENVNIWLGLATENSAMGMEVLRYLAGPQGQITQSYTNTQSPWEAQLAELVLAGLKGIMDRA